MTYVNSSLGIMLPARSRAGRDTAKASKAHFTGHLIAGVGVGCVVQVESHLEMKAALVLLARPDVVDLEEQVPFTWTDGQGRQRTHFFDFRITLMNEARVALAVKPSARLKSGRFIDEMQVIAAQVPERFASAVRIFSDADIDPIELHNAELFAGMRAADPDADAAAASVASSLLGAASLADLAAQLGLGARGLRALIRQIAARQLKLLRAERIVPQSLVVSA